MLKKKLKKFFTLSRRTEGFTLVELIVVIAILGILAGVGTVGYSGYIKNANKNADKVLVGNIIRAVETGTNSYSFIADNSFAVGNIAYPVGFIVLTTEGTEVHVSSSDEVAPVNGDCVFITVNNVAIVTSSTVGKFCGGSQKETGDGYVITTGRDITYCKTHTSPESVAAGIRSLGDTGEKYTTSYSCNKTGFHFTHNYVPVETPLSNVIIADASYLYQPSSKDNTLCEYAYANQYGYFTEGDNTKVNQANDPLYQAIVAAFGNVGDLKLSFNGWTTDEGVNYATILNSSDALVQMVKDTGDDLIEINGILGSFTGGYLSEDYEDTEQMMDSYSTYLASKFPENEATPEIDRGGWLEVWNDAANRGFDYTFGMTEPGKYHHDYVYACTKSFNSCFASYLVARGIDPDVAAIFENYSTLPNEDNSLITSMQSVLDGSNQLFGTDYTLEFVPRVVNYASFNDAASPNAPDVTLKSIYLESMKELEGNAYNETNALSLYSDIKDLYDDYIDDSNGTSVCEQNGAVFYDMMVTVSRTGDIASDKNNEVSNGNYFEFYNHYLSEMSDLYSAAKNIKEGIVIIVYVENGLVKCEVSPTVANPRN